MESKKETIQTWTPKYVYSWLMHSWENCPVCDMPFYGMCVKNRYCGECGYDYSFYRPCDKNLQTDMSCMTKNVLGCRSCNGNYTLNQYFICQKCFKAISKSQRQKYQQDVVPEWKQLHYKSQAARKAAEEKAGKLNKQAEGKKEEEYDYEDDYENDYEDDCREEQQYQRQIEAQRDYQEELKRQSWERNFAPDDGYYFTGNGNMVYQSAGSRYNPSCCTKYCGYCGRCASQNWD